MEEKTEFREKLVIKNFLNLKDIEIETNKFNIIIGPNAQGKSYLLNLIYFFREVFESLQNFLEPLDDIIITSFESRLKKGLYNTFSKELLSESNFSISYFFNKSNSIEILAKSSHLDIKISKELKRNIANLLEKNNNEMGWKNRIFNKKMYNTLFGLKSIFNSYFIPDGRKNFFLLRKFIFNIISQSNNIKNTLGSKLMNFLSAFESHNNYYFEENIMDEKILDRNKVYDLIVGVLKANYIQSSNESYKLKLKKGKIIDILESSSGQREMLPILIILILSIFRKGNFESHYFIEEPETHLYPATQKDLVEFFSLVYNQTERSTRYFITTHSPYLLTSLNNLIQADNTFKAKPEKEKEISKVVNKNKWVCFEDVSAYFLEDGKLTDIMDYENRLIKAEEIDRVSDEIVEEYNKLLDIEFGDE